MEPGRAFAGTWVALMGRMPAQHLLGIVVVVVDDDSDALDLFRAVLEYHGALVMCVPGPQPALELLSRMRPDVLLSDMQMPDWDGAWLVAEAHNRGLLRTVGTLVVTAAAMTPQQVRDAGFDAYLRKPVDPHQLCDRVYALARPSPSA
jgi:CheY-like chemotaxis protein